MHGQGERTLRIKRGFQLLDEHLIGNGCASWSAIYHKWQDLREKPIPAFIWSEGFGNEGSDCTNTVDFQFMRVDGPYEIRKPSAKPFGSVHPLLVWLMSFVVEV